ncbi:MAG: hypothetical protein JRH19_27450 [Deltaproteobacteria bacterium]|nr:hypothetical protein [Deltaproteobacteria bacterium]
MVERGDSRRIPDLRLFEGALREELFGRLVRAVRTLGDEQLRRNYTTTFWLPLEQDPTNVAEEAVLELLELVDPAPHCIGVEWWLGRLARGEKLRFHFDRDMTIRKKTGQYVHPLHGSVLYLNAFPSSPTVILDQVPSPDGKSRIPEKSQSRVAFEAVPNHYVVFPGNRRHGVIPASSRSKRAKPADVAEEESEASERRLTLLVNYWERRPLPPICFDYDGTIYADLRSAR